MLKIPVTVFTGYLGSGKSTIILNLVKNLPPDYKIAFLKNEFGDIKVDSLLLKTPNVQVTEMLNGCLCCILVGKMDNALNDIIENIKPDRIIIETSGSAYPAPIALEIRKLDSKLYLDGLINVIDVLNFESYKDTSYTAKIQTQYTDLIVYNKTELVDEAKFELVKDSVNELNSETPKIISKNGNIDPDMIFGIDTQIVIKEIPINNENLHHQDLDADLIEIFNIDVPIDKFRLVLAKLPKWDFYRIKGFIRTDVQTYLINYVFGRYTIEKVSTNNPTSILLLGKNFAYHIKSLKVDLGLEDGDYKIQLRNSD